MQAAAKIFAVITIIFVAILIFWFTQLNYEDLSFKENRNVYFGMSSVALMIFGLQMIKRSIKKSGEKQKNKEDSSSE